MSSPRGVSQAGQAQRCPSCSFSAPAIVALTFVVLGAASMMIAALVRPHPAGDASHLKGSSSMVCPSYPPELDGAPYPPGHAREDVNTSSRPRLPRVLVLTPVKNAEGHLDTYFANLRKLDYPPELISLGLMDSDSNPIQPGPARDAALAQLQVLMDGHQVSLAGLAEALHDDGQLKLTGTLVSLIRASVDLRRTYRRVTVFQHNFSYKLSSAARHGSDKQLKRRQMLARSRNHLLSTALRDEDYVLWIDSDVQSYPAHVLRTLLATGKEIIVPNCVMAPGERSYDLNSWRLKELGNDATVQQVREFHDKHMLQAKNLDDLRALELEGYVNTGHQSLSALRKEGEVVRLDGVGGAMLLVKAELHRHGLVFPPFPYRHRIETEGLSMMALDMDVLSWGMPNVEVIHP